MNLAGLLSGEGYIPPRPILLFPLTQGQQHQTYCLILYRSDLRYLRLDFLPATTTKVFLCYGLGEHHLRCYIPHLHHQILRSRAPVLTQELEEELGMPAEQLWSTYVEPIRNILPKYFNDPDPYLLFTLSVISDPWSMLRNSKQLKVISTYEEACSEHI